MKSAFGWLFLLAESSLTLLESLTGVLANERLALQVSSNEYVIFQLCRCRSKLTLHKTAVLDVFWLAKWFDIVGPIVEEMMVKSERWEGVRGRLSYLGGHENSYESRHYTRHVVVVDIG